MPTKKNGQKSIERLAKEHYSWWGGTFVAIKKNELLIWQGVFLIAFLIGVTVTLVLTISLGIHSYSSAAPRPVITVISPNGGEKYDLGAIIPVKWNQNFKSGQTRVYVVNTSMATIYSSGYMSSISGENNWTLPANAISAAGSYRVNICSQSGKMNYCDPSNAYFTVVSVPVSAILSPNGGEVWIKWPGRSYELSWTISPGACGLGACTIDFIGVDLYYPGNSYVKNIASATTSGSKIIDVNSMPDWRNYKACIKDVSGATLDCSDAPFTIYNVQSLELTVNPRYINFGQSITLSWWSYDYDSCTGSWTGGSVPSSGSATITPTDQTIYRLTCTYSGGIPVPGSATTTVLDTVYFYAGTTRPYTCQPKPATGTEWNTVSSYTQTWNSGVYFLWLPADDPITEYNETPATASCRYKCAAGYSWDGTSCVVTPPVAVVYNSGFNFVVPYVGTASTLTAAQLGLDGNGCKTVTSSTSQQSYLCFNQNDIVSIDTGAAGALTAANGWTRQDCLSHIADCAEHQCRAYASFDASGKLSAITYDRVTRCDHDSDHPCRFYAIFSVKPSTPPLSSVSVSLLDAASDKAGTANVFGPGNGSSYTLPYDWHWRATINQPAGQNVKSIKITNGYYNYWSTDNPSYYPLVVFAYGTTQLNYSYGTQFALGSAANTVDLYGQIDYPEGPSWLGGTMTVTFTDNTTASAPIPASPIVPPSAIQAY